MSRDVEMILYIPAWLYQNERYALNTSFLFRILENFTIFAAISKYRKEKL